MTIKACRLPLAFDAARLQADLELIAPDEWIPHFNAQYHEGGWSGVALRAIGGKAAQLYPDPLATAFADTPVLERCPSLREALAVFQSPLQSVRLLRIAAGAGIREHRDYNLGFEDGEIRMHIPITTNPGVEFVLDGQRMDMRPGECWYLDFNLRHHVRNHGATDRVHLVIDCRVDDWIRALIASADVARFSAEATALGRFRELVLDDDGLRERLRAIEDRDAFIESMVAAGRDRGCAFTADEVRAELRAAQRSWHEREIGR